MKASREQKERDAVPVAEEQPWPSASCFIRPAEKKDYDQIADIINLERSTACPQVFLSSAPVISSDVDKAAWPCRSATRPFIVAIPVGEDMMDQSKWPPNSDRAYQEYVEFKKSQPTPPPSVFGFALVTDMPLGFLSDRCLGSRHSGQVRIFVHSEHRQKSYGTALLDKILLCTSPHHRSIIDYEWRFGHPEGIYDDPLTQNIRQHVRLYVELFCENKLQNEYTWRADMLSKFNFQEVAHLCKAVKTVQGRQWLDVVLWEFEAMETSAIRDVSPPSMSRVLRD